MVEQDSRTQREGIVEQDSRTQRAGIRSFALFALKRAIPSGCTVCKERPDIMSPLS